MLTFEEAIFGVEKEIEITRDEVCDTCHGKGAEPGSNPANAATAAAAVKCARYARPSSVRWCRWHLPHLRRTR